MPGLIRLEMAVTTAESMPEERKVPTSTSEIIWYSTDSVSTLRSFSAFASKDSFDGVWNR